MDKRKTPLSTYRLIWPPPIVEVEVISQFPDKLESGGSSQGRGGAVLPVAVLLLPERVVEVALDVAIWKQERIL